MLVKHELHERFDLGTTQMSKTWQAYCVFQNITYQCYDFHQIHKLNTLKGSYLLQLVVSTVKMATGLSTFAYPNYLSF